MKINNLLIITIIFILSIIILFLLLKNKEMGEIYQPPPYKGPKLVGIDPFVYLILPELTLEELNRFAYSSKRNMDVVRSYLQRIYPSLTLSAINKGMYFKEDDIIRPEVLDERYKKIYKNKPVDEIQKLIQRRYNYLTATTFYLHKLVEIFNLLGAGFIQDFTIPGDNRIEDKKMFLIDFSNLPITSKTFNEKFLEGQDLAVKLIKNQDNLGLTIKVFIRKGTYPYLNKKLKDLSKEIQKFNGRDNGAFMDNDLKILINKVYSSRGNKEIGDNFSFSFPQIITEMNNEINYQKYIRDFRLDKKKEEERKEEEEEERKDEEMIPPTEEEILEFIRLLRESLPQPQKRDKLENVIASLKSKFKKGVIELMSKIQDLLLSSGSILYQEYLSEAFKKIRNNPQLFTKSVIKSLSDVLV